MLQFDLRENEKKKIEYLLELAIKEDNFKLDILIIIKLYWFKQKRKYNYYDFRTNKMKWNIANNYVSKRRSS